MDTQIDFRNDLAGLRTQVDALERDPNATEAFKQMLEDWLKQMGAAAGQPSPGGDTPPAQQSAPSPEAAQPAAQPVQTPPLDTPAEKSKLLDGKDGGIEAKQASKPSDAPAPDTRSQGIVNVSGADKTITMSNTSGKDMVLYHTGGDGGATKAVATLKPGESVDVTVGNNTSGAFTKGDANGNFTSDSGRVEYSVRDGKMAADLDSECGVDAMSLQAGDHSKKVDDVTNNAPANLKDSSGRLLEAKSHPEVQAYLDSIDGYNLNSYTHSDSDVRNTHVMDAANMDIDKISASFS